MDKKDNASWLFFATATLRIICHHYLILHILFYILSSLIFIKIGWVQIAFKPQPLACLRIINEHLYGVLHRILILPEFDDPWIITVITLFSQIQLILWPCVRAAFVR